VIAVQNFAFVVRLSSPGPQRNILSNSSQLSVKAGTKERTQRKGCTDPVLCINGWKLVWGSAKDNKEASRFLRYLTSQ